MVKRGRGKEFDSRPFEVTTSFRTLEERQRRDLDRRLKVAHQKAEARKQKELQIKKEKKAIILELKKRRQNIAFEKSIKNASPVKSYAVFDEKRQREEINFQPESLMTGEHFASRLGEAFQKEVNDAKGLQKEVLISRLKSRFNSKEKSYPSSETFDDIGRRNFNKLISLIAKKAYLDLGIETDGKTYTKLESQISALSSKIARNGLPINLTFTFGSIRIRTSNLEEKGFQANPLFDWKLPKWAKLGGVSTATVATVIACGGEAPPAEHAPVEEDGEKAAPVTPEEEVEEQALAAEEGTIDIPLSEINGQVTQTAEIPATEAAPATAEAAVEGEVSFAKSFSELTILLEDGTDSIEKQAPEFLASVIKALNEKAREIGITNFSIEVREFSGIWTAVIKDSNTGQIWFAVGAKSGSVFPQLMPIGDIINDEGGFNLETRPLCDGCVEQEIASNGSTFTPVGVDAEGNPGDWMDETKTMIRAKAEVEFPAGLDVPVGASYADKDHIIDENGKALWVRVYPAEQGGVATEETGEWIKDYERSLNAEGSMDLNRFRENQLIMEDIDEGRIENFFEAVLKPEFQEKTDWSIVKDWPFVGNGDYMIYWSGEDNDVKFPDEKTAPFIKDTGFCGEMVDGEKRYIYILFALRDVDNQEIEYTNLAAPLQKEDGTPLTQAEIKNLIRILEEVMNFYPIIRNSTRNAVTKNDPLFARLIEEKDLRSEIWGHIIKNSPTGDMSRLKELRHFIFPTEGIEILEENYDGLFTNMYK